MKKKWKQISLGICAMAMMCGCTATAADTLTEKNIEEPAAAADETSDPVTETETESVVYGEPLLPNAYALWKELPKLLTKLQTSV